jgi:hypothetical protein
MTIAGFGYNPDHYITRPDPTRPDPTRVSLWSSVFCGDVAKVAMIHRKI